MSFRLCNPFLFPFIIIILFASASAQTADAFWRIVRSQIHTKLVKSNGMVVATLDESNYNRGAVVKLSPYDVSVSDEYLKKPYTLQYEFTGAETRTLVITQESGGIPSKCLELVLPMRNCAQIKSLRGRDCDIPLPFLHTIVASVVEARSPLSRVRFSCIVSADNEMGKCEEDGKPSWFELSPWSMVLYGAPLLTKQHNYIYQDLVVGSQTLTPKPRLDLDMSAEYCAIMKYMYIMGRVKMDPANHETWHQPKYVRHFMSRTSIEDRNDIIFETLGQFLRETLPTLPVTSGSKPKTLKELYRYFSNRKFSFKGGNGECELFMTASRILSYVREKYIDPILTQKERLLIRYLDGSNKNLEVQCEMPGPLDISSANRKGVVELSDIQLSVAKRLQERSEEEESLDRSRQELREFLRSNKISGDEADDPLTVALSETMHDALVGYLQFNW